ncbi:protein ADP-ribosylarginine hydrolase-like protein 1 [Anguilla anguilla]|uniref:protein ADP-ribosylarginine hydrolase-like protein 1 n=1 Tax=Anguilla anguilla TaxID=7936 RepID=UPI0015B015D3|nr:protein ADP-ribosylarginine hydrolase-like protein 1 [Anguilla anguilla]
MERYCAGMLLLEAGGRVGYHGARRGGGARRGSLVRPEEVWRGLERALERVEKRRLPLDLLTHIATAEALLAGMKSQHTFCREAARRYLIALEKYLSCNEDKRNATKTGTDPGTSAAVRGLCIGMRFPRPEHVTELIHASVECGRMTHTCPTGFLGCVCMALFASYAVQGQPVSRWGRLMLGALPRAEQYCRGKPALFTDYSENWFYFETKWQFYLQQRKIDREGCDEPFFPENYDSTERNKLYRHWSAASPGKRKGVAITLMVYDAILGAGGDWTRLCQWALCHGGDSEGTGSMVGCLYGLLYGSLGVPSSFLLNLGLKGQMEGLGAALYAAANGERPELGDAPVSSGDAPISSGEFHADLWQAVKRLSCKRTDDEINTLLNYLALLEQGVASRQDRGQPREDVGRGRGRGKGAVRPPHPYPSRFQLLRSRFTKLGHRDNLLRLRPPPLERPITTSPKPLPWKYRTHCYAKDLCTPPAPKVLLSVGMRGGRLVKIS